MNRAPHVLESRLVVVAALDHHGVEEEVVASLGGVVPEGPLYHRCGNCSCLGLEACCRCSRLCADKEMEGTVHGWGSVLAADTVTVGASRPVDPDTQDYHIPYCLLVHHNYLVGDIDAEGAPEANKVVSAATGEEAHVVPFDEVPFYSCAYAARLPDSRPGWPLENGSS